MKRFGAFVLGLCLAASASSATFTVTNTDDSGTGSYRQALEGANANPGLDTIAFNVAGPGCNGAGVCTIAPTAPLPNISSPVLIDGYTQPGASPNTNAQGALNTVLKIVLSGVNIPGQTAVSISGATAGSTVRGLVINGPFNYTVVSSFSDGDTLAGCFVGTDVSGTAAVPAGRAVHSEFAPNFRVGGPSPADRNLISGNSVSGISVFNGANLLVEGNLIGTDITGAVPLRNNQDAVYIGINCPGSVVRNNVIADAQFNGLVVGDPNGVSHGITIEGNWIGTDVTGTIDLGNTINGIYILGQENAVGGIGPGEGNVIAFNGQAGVLVSYSTIGIFNNPIRGNSIYGNNTGPTGFGASDQGIDLGNPGGSGAGGLTINDLDDADIGPNLNQNMPVISSAVSAGGNTTVTGRLNSTPNTGFDLDFYVNDACVGRPQEFREGQTYVGSDEVTTDGGGDADIEVVLNGVTLAPGEVVTATATDPAGNTSEFSQRIVVSMNPSSGNPDGASTTLSGFHFLPGATVTVGGAPASNVDVTGYNTITATMPNLPPGSLNNVTVTNTDGAIGTLPNGWIADFLDVPGNQQFYSFVTTLVRNAITAGVGGGIYGVAQNTLRQQMAVFLLKSKYGICYVPPPCTVPEFPDVPCTNIFAAWINELVAQGITTGCGGGLFCPANPVNRQQMAVFLLKTLEGSAYTPPACTVETFTDVPCTSPFAPWIYELVARDITAGCGNGTTYCPLNSANRGQMATFLVKTFDLQ